MKVPPDLQSLLGNPVSGVAFVQDYVEIHFDGAILRALTPLTVTCGSKRSQLGEPGFCNLLRELIGKSVSQVTEFKNDRIEVFFGSKCSLRIPIDEASRTTHETAHFLAEHGGPLSVW